MSRAADKFGKKAVFRNKIRKPRGPGQPTYREAAITKARRSIRQHVAS